MTTHELLFSSTAGRLSVRDRFVAQREGLEFPPVPRRNFVECSCGWHGPCFFTSPEAAAEYGQGHVERMVRVRA